MTCLCVSSIFIPIATARDAFAPSWLKEDTYAKYDTNTGLECFFNVTDPNFAGTNYMLSQKIKAFNTISSSLMWQCVSVNATMAKMQITLDFVGKPVDVSDSFENVSIQRTGEAYVDLYTRGVYNAEGTFLGTTHLWLPANPNNDQEIILWEENSETITTTATISDRWTTTIQGTQDTFQIKETRVKDQYQLGSHYYDLDTGLCVGNVFMWDPIFAVVGISTGVISAGISETNIDLGPERSEINWNQTLQYSIIPIAIILLVVTLIIKHKKRKTDP
jgi:hypothetical protein